MNSKVEEFIKAIHNFKPIGKKIIVYGWQFNYDLDLFGSVIPFLPKKLDIIENIAKESNNNRDLRIKPKMYITIHDTGDTLKTHTAKFWSDTVYNEKLMDTNVRYAASFQYVVGNDGIYHNIPDNEVAYHAGDSTKFDYHLYNTGVYNSDVKTKEKYQLDIKNGFYYINKEQTLVKAPLKEDGTPAPVDELNTQGILVKNINGEYFIGETYYNNDYNMIANRGGNNNSIGMEVCVNQETDLYYTYQLSAKLTARLLIDNNLKIEDIKQHHYFSGKDCPMTLRKNQLWNYFLELVYAEKLYQELLDSNYLITFVSNNQAVDELGRIKKIDSNEFDFDLIIEKGNTKYKQAFTKKINYTSSK